MAGRRRRLRPFFILTMLFYGRHRSVTWETADTFVIKTGPLASSINIKTAWVRRDLEFLAKHKYVLDLSLCHGSIRGTLAPRPRRLVDDDEEVA